MSFRPRIASTAATVMFAATSTLASPSADCVALLSGERLTIAVPNNAGGGYDTYARSLAPAIERHGPMSVRVVNMPAAGGLAARGFVMNADPDDLALLIENTADIVAAPMANLGRGEQATKDFMIEAFDIVGILYSEPSAWLGRADLDVHDPDLAHLVASEGALEEALLPFIVTGLALGIEVSVVTGYEGTGEMSAAILRGEADISNMSVTTALRRAEDEALDVIMTLSEGPYPGTPDVPYLAGEGSVSWDRAADLPEAEAADRRNLALAAARLRGTARGLFVSTNMSAERRDCLAEILDAASADPDFVATAEAQGRPVEVQDATEARAFVDGLRATHAAVLPTLERLAEDFLRN